MIEKKLLKNNKKALFIHIPKCAGVSIAQALNSKINLRQIGPHAKCVDIFEPRGKFKRKDYFIFSFTRNPWDRLVSTFFYIMKGGRNAIDKKRRDMYLKKYKGNFRNFVLDIENWFNIKEKNSIYRDGFIPHFRPQFEFIYNKNGKRLADFVGSVENIKEDFDKLCALMSINRISLPRSNKSAHMEYYKYYDKKTRDIVFRYYAKDIEYFLYQFMPKEI